MIALLTIPRDLYFSYFQRERVVGVRILFIEETAGEGSNNGEEYRGEFSRWAGTVQNECESSQECNGQDETLYTPCRLPIVRKGTRSDSLAQRQGRRGQKMGIGVP